MDKNLLRYPRACHMHRAVFFVFNCDKNCDTGDPSDTRVLVFYCDIHSSDIYISYIHDLGFYNFNYPECCRFSQISDILEVVRLS